MLSGFSGVMKANGRILVIDSFIPTEMQPDEIKTTFYLINHFQKFNCSSASVGLSPNKITL